MALPAGLNSFTLTFGPYSNANATDTAFAGMEGILTVSPPIVATSSGAVLIDRVTFYVGNDGTATVTSLVPNDDPGINQGTAYTVTWQGLTSRPLPPNKTFVVHVADGATIDYDKLTAVTGTVAVPVASHGIPAGGTSGQALTKGSSTDYDAGWSTLTAASVGADASGAAASAQAFAIQRANHTGTQPASTVTGLDGAVAGIVTPGGSATAAAIAADPALRAAFVGLPTGGSDGQALVKSGSSVVWGSGGSSGAPLLTPTATKTAPYTAAAGDLAMMNVPAGGATLTLPAAPANKTQVGYRAIGATNAVPLTVNRGGSDTIGTTGATSAVLPMADEVVVLQYDAPNTRWLGVSAVKSQASLDGRYGGSYGLTVGRANAVVPVGTHNAMFGNLTTTTETTVSYRGFYPLSDPACTTVLPVFQNQPNLSGNQAGDSQPPNPITISASCELSDGTVVPFYFNGSRTVTIAAGQIVIPDFPINFGAQVTDSATGMSGLSGVVIRTYVSVTASRSDTVTVTSGSATVTDSAILASDQGRVVTGTGVPANSYVGTVTAGVSFLLSTKPDSQVNVNATANGTSVTISSVIPQNNGIGANGNLKVSSTDLTAEGSAAGKTGFGGSNSNVYGPSLLLAPAQKVRKPIVASLTDSIFFGTSDLNIGPVAKACAQYGFGHVKLSRVGETAATYVTPGKWKYRRQLLTGSTHAVIELGTNDGIDTTGKATTLQTNLTTLLTFLNSIGIKSVITTVPPKGNSSTDGYATTAGQSANSNAAASAQINGWIRGLVGTLGVVGVIDMNSIVSSSVDSGLWAQAANGRHLTDLATTSGSNVVTSATANFTNADIGSGIYVTGVYTSYVAQIQSLNSSSSVNVFNYSNPASPTAYNAGSTVSSAVGGVGAWYATQDGTHPSAAMMTGGILTAVQNALASLSV